MSRTSRAPIRLAIAGLVGAAAAIAFSAPAFAHSTITDSTPGEGEVLTTLPAEFSVTANEDVLDAAGTGEGFVLAILDADGTHYESGEITIDGATVSTDAIVGQAGDYVLEYRVVSGDGHPIEGEIPFSWAPDASAAPLPGDSPADPEEQPQPISAPIETSGPPEWLGGAVAIVLLAAGAIAAAARRSDEQD